MDLVDEVSVNTIGQLLDEGVHDELEVGPSAGLLIFLLFTGGEDTQKVSGCQKDSSN